MRKKCHNDRRGFTLVELMLVVIIIGILVAMVMPRLAGRTEQARESAARADIESNIGTALDLYELDNGAYPTAEEGLSALMTKPAQATHWKGPYLKKKPVDPWGNPYVYKQPGPGGLDYELHSCGKDGAEGGNDDISNAQTEAPKEE